MPAGGASGASCFIFPDVSASFAAPLRGGRVPSLPAPAPAAPPAEVGRGLDTDVSMAERSVVEHVCMGAEDPRSLSSAADTWLRTLPVLSPPDCMAPSTVKP